MDWLSDHRVDMINDILVENGVTYDELRDDLLDHICCLVEEQMDDGKSFQQGLDLALDRFGLNQLKIIQETTLYLINSKLNTMKKTIGIIGLITSLLVIVGVLFKILHFPGANIMLVLGITGAALIVFSHVGLFGDLVSRIQFRNLGQSDRLCRRIGHQPGRFVQKSCIGHLRPYFFGEALVW